MPTAVRRSIIAVLLVIVGASIFGVTQLDSSPSAGVSDIIENISPGNNDKVLQQSPVEIDLLTGWDGALTIDQREIPDDQLTKVGVQGRISFEPGPGKVFEFFPAGQNCASLTYWQIRTGPETALPPYTWCFTVL